MRPFSEQLATVQGARLTLLSLGFLCSASVAAAQTAPPAPPPPVAASAWPDIDTLIGSVAPRPEPDLFGFTTLRLAETIYDQIWREVISQPWPERPELDAFVEHLRALPVRGRIDEANAWINARVRYGADPNLIDHHWGSLDRTLADGRGEREDIAIAKRQLLIAAGVPAEDVYLVLVSDIQQLRPDALLVVRDEDRVYVLDSKQDALVDQTQMGRYLPIISLGYRGKWIFGRRAPAVTTLAARGRAAGETPVGAISVGTAAYQSLLPQAH